MGQEEALATLRRENLALQDEEAALLDQAGYPPDALEETPYCPLCNDRGWRGAAMCDCLKDLCRQEQIAELSSLLDLGDQSFDTFRLDYYDRQTWPEFHRSPRENMEFILSSCRSYAENFDAYPHKNLFFNGPPAWERPSSRPALPGWCRNRGMPWFTTPQPTSSPGLKPGNLPGMGEESRQAEADTRRYLTCDLLILDDLGSEFTSPFVQAALYELINTRLIEGKRTVISSNLNLEGVRQRYSPRWPPGWRGSIC